jgi:hypothetical protein
MPVHRDVLKGDPGTEPEQQHKHGATDERLEAHSCPQALQCGAKVPAKEGDGLGNYDEK